LREREVSEEGTVRDGRAGSGSIAALASERRVNFSLDASGLLARPRAVTRDARAVDAPADV